MRVFMDVRLGKDTMENEDFREKLRTTGVGEEFSIGSLFPGIEEKAMLRCIEDTAERKVFVMTWGGVVGGKFSLFNDGKGGEIILKEVVTP